MSDRLQHFDQTHALFAAMRSFMGRLLVFFACCSLGHYVGLNSASAAAFFENVWSSGPRAIFDHGDLNPIWVPISWLGTLLVACRDGWGVIQLFVLGAAFRLVWLSGDRFIHGFGIALLTQPVESFLVAVPGGPAFFVGLIVLITWEAFAAGAYWWCWKQLAQVGFRETRPPPPARRSDPRRLYHAAHGAAERAPGGKRYRPRRVRLRVMGGAASLPAGRSRQRQTPPVWSCRISGRAKRFASGRAGNPAGLLRLPFDAAAVPAAPTC